jgi:hypothetical protein
VVGWDPLTRRLAGVVEASANLTNATPLVKVFPNRRAS